MCNFHNLTSSTYCSTHTIAINSALCTENPSVSYLSLTVLHIYYQLSLHLSSTTLEKAKLAFALLFS